MMRSYKSRSTGNIPTSNMSSALFSFDILITEPDELSRQLV